MGTTWKHLFWANGRILDVVVRSSLNVFLSFPLLVFYLWCEWQYVPCIIALILLSYKTYIPLHWWLMMSCLKLLISLLIGLMPLNGTWKHRFPLWFEQHNSFKNITYVCYVLFIYCKLQYINVPSITCCEIYFKPW